MSLISARTDDRPAMLSRQSDGVSALGPLVKYTIRCEQLLSSLSLFIALRSYFIASHFLSLIKFIAAQAVIASKPLLFSTANLVRTAIWAAWDSPRIKHLRKKVEMEFFTFILGGGNSIFLMMFWPGWWIMGIVILTICCSYIR